MNARNKHVTRSKGLAKWNVSTTTGHGINGAELSVFQIIPGRKFGHPHGMIRYAALNGKLFPSSDAAFEAAAQHGYTIPYGRNTVEFVMSRAARRRGWTTTNWIYLRHKEIGKN